MIDGKTIGVVIPAAGSGRRMGGATAKQFLELHGKPILVRTLQRFDSAPAVDEIVVAVGEGQTAAVEELVRLNALRKVRAVVPGGVQRQDSVRCALERITADIVLVHDAVRPFASHHLIAEVAAAAIRTGAAIAAVPPKETIKISDGSGAVLSTPERSHVWVAQTPQGFATAVLIEAFQQARKDGFTGTDDASLVERLGVRVSIVEGSYDNIKITTPEDVDLAGHIFMRVMGERSNLVF